MDEPRFFSRDDVERAVLRDGTKVALRLIRPKESVPTRKTCRARDPQRLDRRIARAAISATLAEVLASE